MFRKHSPFQTGCTFACQLIAFSWQIWREVLSLCIAQETEAQWAQEFVCTFSASVSELGTSGFKNKVLLRIQNCWILNVTDIDIPPNFLSNVQMPPNDFHMTLERAFSVCCPSLYSLLYFAFYAPSQFNPHILFSPLSFYNDKLSFFLDNPPPQSITRHITFMVITYLKFKYMRNHTAFVL